MKNENYVVCFFFLLKNEENLVTKPFLKNVGNQTILIAIDFHCIQVHLNKLECRGKVNFSNSTQIVKLVY